jgi:hypothetical protein
MIITGNEIVYGAVAGGAVVTVGWGLMTMVLRRQVSRVLEHVDDEAVHVHRNNGYVRAGVCEKEHKHVAEQLADNKREIELDRQRTDKLVETQSEHIQAILLAINEIKAKL